MNSIELQTKITSLRKALIPQLQEIERLELELSRTKSLEFIATNNITLNDVQRSDEVCIPFSTVWDFGKWMMLNGCAKPWCGWNGRLYSTNLIKSGTLQRDAPGLFKDVPQ